MNIHPDRIGHQQGQFADYIFKYSKNPSIQERINFLQQCLRREKTNPNPLPESQVQAIKNKVAFLENLLLRQEGF